MATHELRPASVCRVAGIYVGSVVGAGFASGREIWWFFARFGPFGFVGIVAASAMFCVLAPVLMRTMRSNGFAQYGDLYRHYLTSRVAGVVDGATTVYLFGVLSVMFTGSASLAGSVLGLSPCWSAAVTATFLIVLTAQGLNWVATATSLLSPVLVAGVSLLCVEHIFTGQVTPYAHARSEPVMHMIAGSSGSSLVYVSYNMLLCLGVFASLASSKHKTADLTGGGILGGAVLGLMSSLVLVTLSTEPVEVAGADMPLLSVASQRGGVIYASYLVAVWAAMVTTALGMLLSLISRLSALHPSRRGDSGRSQRACHSWLGAVLVMLCVPISYVGFGLLVDRVYLVFGLVGFVILALVLRSSHTQAC